MGPLKSGNNNQTMKSVSDECEDCSTKTPLLNDHFSLKRTVKVESEHLPDKLA